MDVLPGVELQYSLLKPSISSSVHARRCNEMKLDIYPCQQYHLPEPSIYLDLLLDLPLPHRAVRCRLTPNVALLIKPTLSGYGVSYQLVQEW